MSTRSNTHQIIERTFRLIPRQMIYVFFIELILNTVSHYQRLAKFPAPSSSTTTWT